MSIQHMFGGEHTELKLRVLGDYITAYKKVMQNQQFNCRYIDAFAGSGQRQENVPGHAMLNLQSETNLYSGSVKIALESECFSHYLFIEPHKKRNELLHDLCDNHQKKAHVTIKKDDANKVLKDVMQQHHNWNDRGIVFLDPYGMEVQFDTLQAISKTKKYDVLYLFPYSGLYRQLKTRVEDKEHLEQYKIKSVCRLLGLQEQDLLSTFYRKHPQKELFDDAITFFNRKNKDDLLRIVTSKLNEVFVCLPKPITIKSNSGFEFALFLMLSNPSPRAINVAKKIFAHIRKNARQQ